MLVADIIRAGSSYTPVFSFAGEHIWSGRDHELTEQMIKSPYQSIEQTNSQGPEGVRNRKKNTIFFFDAKFRAFSSLSVRALPVPETKI